MAALHEAGLHEHLPDGQLAQQTQFQSIHQVCYFGGAKKRYRSVQWLVSPAADGVTGRRLEANDEAVADLDVVVDELHPHAVG